MTTADAAERFSLTSCLLFVVVERAAAAAAAARAEAVHGLADGGPGVPGVGPGGSGPGLGLLSPSPLSWSAAPPPPVSAVWPPLAAAASAGARAGGAALRLSLWLVAAEAGVDAVKHSFLAKYAGMRPGVYAEFTVDLLRRVPGAEGGASGSGSGSGSAVSADAWRFSLPSVPLRRRVGRHPGGGWGGREAEVEEWRATARGGGARSREGAADGAAARSVDSASAAPTPRPSAVSTVEPGSPHPLPAERCSGPDPSVAAAHRPLAATALAPLSWLAAGFESARRGLSVVVLGPLGARRDHAAGREMGVDPPALCALLLRASWPFLMGTLGAARSGGAVGGAVVGGYIGAAAATPAASALVAALAGVGFAAGAGDVAARLGASARAAEAVAGAAAAAAGATDDDVCPAPLGAAVAGALSAPWARAGAALGARLGANVAAVAAFALLWLTLVLAKAAVGVALRWGTALFVRPGSGGAGGRGGRAGARGGR